jgi:S-formylglutathione hydrolase FrmB
VLPIPLPEHGSLVVEGITSAALDGRATVWIYLPPGYERDKETRYPVLTLLHGAYGWEWDWFLKGRAHITTDRLISEGTIPAVIVLTPSDGLRGDGSLYVNWARNGGRYEDWIAKDLVAWADANLRTVASREGRCIAGLSMGGYGAVNIGLRNRTTFRAIATHSGFFDPAPIVNQFYPTRATSLFATGADMAESTPYEYIERIPKGELPPLYIDCGAEDFLVEPNRLMHKRLEALGIAHVYSEFPGAHTWEYWSEHVTDSLKFLLGKGE